MKTEPFVFKGVAIGTSGIGSESGKKLGKSEVAPAVIVVEEVRPGITQYFVGRGRLPGAGVLDRRKGPADPPYPKESDRRRLSTSSPMPVEPDFDAQRDRHVIHEICFDRPAFFTGNRAGS